MTPTLATHYMITNVGIQGMVTMNHIVGTVDCDDYHFLTTVAQEGEEIDPDDGFARTLWVIEQVCDSVQEYFPLRLKEYRQCHPHIDLRVEDSLQRHQFVVFVGGQLKTNDAVWIVSF